VRSRPASRQLGDLSGTCRDYGSLLSGTCRYFANSTPPASYPFDEVASGPTYKQGRFFPSDEIDRIFVDAWNSEGDLVSTTASYLGDDVVATAFRRHRETYISDVDLATMRDADIGVMRVNVGWYVSSLLSMPHRRSSDGKLRESEHR
jgi:hypothetical protein